MVKLSRKVQKTIKKGFSAVRQRNPHVAPSCVEKGFPDGFTYWTRYIFAATTNHWKIIMFSGGFSITVGSFSGVLLKIVGILFYQHKIQLKIYREKYKNKKKKKKTKERHR